MKRFEEICVLGDGAFGTVTKCRDKDTGDIVAIKKMKQRSANFEECLQLKEIKSLRKIKHENVVKLLQVFRENDHLFLVFEFLPNGCLLKTIQNHNGPFTEPEIRFIISQLLSGLNYVHRQGFFHRDIKPENLLWNGNTLKIADFGLAREIRSRPPYTEYVSTRWYRAPEIILRHEFYNSPVDIWAVGAIMAELYMMKPIFQGTSETDQLYKICSILGSPASSWPESVKLATKLNIRFPQNSSTPLSSLMPNASPEALDLMSELLRYDPSKRPSAAQALQHKFFQGEKCPIIQRNARARQSPNQKQLAPQSQIQPQIFQQKNQQFHQVQLNDKPFQHKKNPQNDDISSTTNDHSEVNVPTKQASYLISNNINNPSGLHQQTTAPRPMGSRLNNVISGFDVRPRGPTQSAFDREVNRDRDINREREQRDHFSRLGNIVDNGLKSKPQSRLDRFVTRPNYIAGGSQFRQQNLNEPGMRQPRPEFSFNDDLENYVDPFFNI